MNIISSASEIIIAGVSEITQIEFAKIPADNNFFNMRIYHYDFSFDFWKTALAVLGLAFLISIFIRFIDILRGRKSI